MAKLQLAKGARDIPPEIKLIKNEVINKLQTSFERYGFSPIETPILERMETLNAKFAAGEASDALSEIFNVTDNANRALALRFDLTVPFARYVAMNKGMKMPIKRYEIGRVYRDGPIKLGRYREFWQSDCDIVGTKSMLAEAELLAIAQNFFKSINVDTVIKVNNRKVLTVILKQVGIETKKEIESAIISIDKLDKIQISGVTKELLEKGFNEEQTNKLFQIIKPGITIKQLKDKLGYPEAMQGLKELEELFSYLKSQGTNSAVFDISLARGLAYYTGTVFEAFDKDPSGPVKSSLCGGGRYDDMIGGFQGGNQIVPAVGISFGIEPTIDILKSQKQKGDKNKPLAKSPAQLYIIPIGDEAVTNKCLEIASEFREADINVAFSIGKKGVSKNLDYANYQGIPFVAIIGKNELETDKISLKNMFTGDEQKISVEEAVLLLEKSKN